MKSRWRVDAEFQISRRFHPASNQRCSLWIQKIRWPRYRARVFHAFIVMLSKNTCLYPFNFILLGIGRAEYVLGMIYLLVIWAKALLIKLLVKAFLHLNKSVSQLKFGREEPRASLHATMVNLDFPDGSSPPSHILRSRKSQSPGKHASKPSPSSSSSRIWNEEDELTVLKGLVDYQAQKGIEPRSNWADFYRFLLGGGSFITGKFSKEQVLSKIRKLKAKFIASMHKGNTSQSEAFLLSKSIWGLLNESHHSTKTAEMANHEPSNNDVTEADFEGNDESSWAVRDAFETMVSKGLSDYQKMLQLQKLMNLGSAKRKELSDEWNELCAEEVKLNIKRLKFSAMLAEAAKW
ncbi:GLABROUS1 enhancer-binding protein isoform X2 [Brassica rapa]|uniref:GLABROUS1 enhancer-binding protein isoform X2 n=1 Tax=Brassica campestris TaxID=3711 RepID=UPI000872866C|nr:GLABROUS1 enhancer-binding protein isoform X2 [Brassica rapa]